MTKNDKIWDFNWVPIERILVNPTQDPYSLSYLLDLLENADCWDRVLLCWEGPYNTVDVLLSIASVMDIDLNEYLTYDDLYEAVKGKVEK